MPTVRLTEIFRQAAQSAIVRNAHMVNHGELPNLRQNTGDFFFLARREGKGGNTEAMACSVLPLP